MSIVYTSHVQEGMILSEDIFDLNNRLILHKGTKIEEKHLKTLKIWGITEIRIEGEIMIEEEFVETDEHVKKIVEETKYKFKFTDNSHPAVLEIIRKSAKYRVDNQIFIKKIETPPYDLNDLVKLNRDDLENIFNYDIKLPEMPSIIVELNKVINDPFSSTEDIAKIVNNSPSLAAVLLKIVNSSFYGFRSKIDTISRAVAIIGTSEIADLAFGVSMVSLSNDLNNEFIEIKSHLKHSLLCGIVSRILATHKNLYKTEQLFVAGLLHDIGRLIMFKYMPEHSKGVLKSSITSEKLLLEEENRLLGLNHTDIAKFLFERWKLPDEIEDCVINHHTPLKAKDITKATIIHVADIIVHGLGLGSSGELFVPPLDYEAWKLLNLSPSIFDVIIKQANHQFLSLKSFFE